MSFWFRAQIKRPFENGLSAGEKKNNIHTPLVAVIALVPLFGGAYLLSRPLRKKVLIRLVVDQMATVLPFRAYNRFRMPRWLAPPASGPAVNQPETDG